MGHVKYFFWLASEAPSVAILAPVYAILAFAGLVIALVATVRHPELLHGKWKWLLLPFAIPIAILVYGVAFKYDGDIGTAPAWRALLIAIMFWSHVPIGLALIFIARRNWLVPVGLSAFQMWLSLCAAFMSCMSVTNVWL